MRAFWNASASQERRVSELIAKSDVRISVTRILLIDDDQVDRAAVRRALRSSALPDELVEAPDGATGLRRSDGESFEPAGSDIEHPA